VTTVNVLGVPCGYAAAGVAADVDAADLRISFEPSDARALDATR
jgi:hypothetical protein